MDRRLFFGMTLKKAAEAIVGAVESRAQARAAHWIRPPFAVNELDFLLACTRCEKCVEACPHQVLFSLPGRLGPDVAQTPAMDLLNKGCHLCADWPCVSACEPGVLHLPESDPEGDPTTDEKRHGWPRLAVVVIHSSRCLPFMGPECGACGMACPIPGALRWHGTRPSIDENLCTGCALCRVSCPTSPKAVEVRALPGRQDKTNNGS